MIYRYATFCMSLKRSTVVNLASRRRAMLDGLRAIAPCKGRSNNNNNA